MPPRPLATLIVDDEELARRGLRTRLNRIPRVQIVGECDSGRHAVASIRSLSPDLVLLDIQMPGLDGFDVIETIGASAMPPVIFVTAYDEHALRAFEVHALDYLLKPIDNDRLVEAIKRCRERVGTDREDMTERLAALLSEAEMSEDHRFVIKSGGRIRFVQAEAIDWVEAAGDYVRLYSSGTVHLLRETMAEMTKRLPDDFLRIHRSTIVNTRRIEELRPYGNSEFIVVLEDGTERKLSRSYRDDLTDFFDGAI
ncbi:DNA-binding response regulator [Longibacter salinarum]|uniref:DNA-binding response regulator n=1 Tax=Longibacter salinarum TaxID=1850348 RepID=A0A2A8CZ69_9BACT|nr:LytTR family DNA-binding domain-containing protein [Longibacter salinarum]PEN13975.1 DNA-binding response regulator [Longibacter salinarum]